MLFTILFCVATIFYLFGTNDASMLANVSKQLLMPTASLLWHTFFDDYSGKRRHRNTHRISQQVHHGSQLVSLDVSSALEWIMHHSDHFLELQTFSDLDPIPVKDTRPITIGISFACIYASLSIQSQGVRMHSSKLMASQQQKCRDQGSYERLICKACKTSQCPNSYYNTTRMLSQATQH